MIKIDKERLNEIIEKYSILISSLWSKLLYIKKVIHNKIKVVSTIFILFCVVITYNFIKMEISKFISIKNIYFSLATNEAIIISELMEYTFEYTKQIHKMIGSQLIGHENDLIFISGILSNAKIYNPKLSYSWSSFDWVNNKNFQTVNSQIGIREVPQDMSGHEYTKTCPQYPWTLQFAKPIIGNPSKVQVIPAATGITDQNGHYLGAIVVGFSVNDLLDQIKQFTSNDNLKYVITDKNGNVFLQIGNENDISYLTTKEMENYPFIIKAGFQKSKILHEFTKNLWLDFLQVLFFALLLFYIIQFVQSKIKR